ncbi:hypothetical protein VTN00DRAFT_2778 [Thermoascus crustaceus]|uniref:uncharacterized protein n=1 Tax=Thermoascus crustaceus TaxID=5088 RepID=UPI003744963A
MAKVLLSLFVDLSIIHSPSFTVLVGPNHTKLTIQCGLAKHVSPPLDHLMNNGHIRESRHRIAVLEDEEVEIFVAFCEYAYTCDYTTPPFKISENSPLRTPLTPADIPPLTPSPPPEQQEARLGEAGDNDDTAEPTPGAEAQGFTAEQPTEQPTPPEGEPGEAVEDDSPSGEEGDEGQKGKKEAAGSVSFDEPAAHLTPPSTPPPGKDEEFQQPAGDMASRVTEWWDQPEQPPVEVKPAENPPGDLPPEEGDVATEGKKDGEQEQVSYAQPAEPKGCLATSYPKRGGSDLPYILFHAKLYVFAIRYAIPLLAKLRLRELHRDLLILQLCYADQDSQLPDGVSLFSVKAKMVLNLMHFTYTKTTRY